MALSAANGSIINTSRFSFRVYLDTGIASRYAAVYFQVALQSDVRTIVILSVRLSVCLSVRLFVCHIWCTELKQLMTSLNQLV